MSLVISHMDSLVTTLGWTLLHFVWQGALIASAYAVFCWLFDKARAAMRYNIGVVMILLMLVAPVLTFGMIYQAPIANTVSSAVAVSSMAATIAVASQDWISVLEAQAEGLMPWAVLAWFFGVLWSGGRIYRDWRQIRSLISDQVRPLPPHWQGIARNLGDAYGIRVAVRVLESGKVAVPMVLGWLKPVILVPSSALFGLSHRQIELLLAHEFAHVRRFDYLVNLIQVTVETLLFYHPAVHWVSARVRHERELCCDEMVVETTGDRLTYARALAGMEELRSFTTTLGMAASGGQLLARISRLTAAPPPQRGVIHWLVGIAVLASGVGMFNTAQMAIEIDAPVAVQPAAPAAPVLTPEPEPAAMELAIRDEPDIAPEPLTVMQSPEPDTAGDPLTVAPVESAASAPVAVQNDKPQSPVEVEPALPTSELEIVEEPVVDVTPVPVAKNELVAVAQAERVALVDQEQRVAAPIEAASPEPSVTKPVVTGGRLISGRQPAFPRKARLKGTEGWVTVRYSIGLDGRVHDLEIIEASPARTFNRSVRRALATWEFEPMFVDGQAVEQSVTRTIQFRMQPGSENFDGCAYETGTRLCRENRDVQMQTSLSQPNGTDEQ